MTKRITPAERRRDDDFAGIVAGLEHAIAIKEGSADPVSFRVRVPADVDVKAIRSREGLSQDAFAAKYGFSPASVRQWEQKRRKPEVTARLLLKVIEHELDAVRRALG